MYLALCAARAAAPAAARASGMDARQAAADPDALYRDRETPASALAAERTWASRLAAFKGYLLAATGVYFVSGIVFMSENEKRRLD